MFNRVPLLAFIVLSLLSNIAYSDDDLLKLYKHLHANPELSFQEKNTAKRIAKELEMLGFNVTRNIGGYGIVGVLKNGDGPTVMLRTDLDALPIKEQTGLKYASQAKGVEQTGQKVSIMHACGHDIHMTVFVGTARALIAKKDQWQGTLMMIGQPAEERGAGARMMLEQGLFTRFPRPDYNLALHVSAEMPVGTVGYVPGWAMANVDSVDITVQGIGGHGAYPHTTKDPVVLASNIILNLQTLVSREIAPTSPAVVTVGSIQGGAKHNIIPDTVELQLTVRSFSDQVREHLLNGIKRIARAEGMAQGLPNDKLPIVTIKDEYTPSVWNDPKLTNRLVSVFKRELGEANVLENKPVMGGEDFARYGRVEPPIPSLLYWLGAVEQKKYNAAKSGQGTLPSLHSPFFAPDAKPTIATGVKTMTSAALSLFGARTGLTKNPDDA